MKIRILSSGKSKLITAFLYSLILILCTTHTSVFSQFSFGIDKYKDQIDTGKQLYFSPKFDSLISNINEIEYFTNGYAIQYIAKRPASIGKYIILTKDSLISKIKIGAWVTSTGESLQFGNDGNRSPNMTLPGCGTGRMQAVEEFHILYKKLKSGNYKNREFI